MLWFAYGALLLWQIVWLVSAIRNKRGWARILILSAASMALALGCAWYFDTLPGYGFMPGWAYFTEVFYSVIAAFVYFLVLLAAAIGALLKK